MTKQEIPDYWYIEPLSEGNVTGAKIIYDWMQTQPGGDHWEIRFAFEYHLRGSSVDDTFQPYGTRSIPIDNKLDIHQLISFADFCINIAKYQKSSKEEPRSYEYLIPFLKLKQLI